MSLHANKTRSDDSAKFPCHSAADPVFAPEIPLPGGWPKSQQDTDLHDVFEDKSDFSGSREKILPAVRENP
jgi:hypothetical protein